MSWNEAKGFGFIAPAAGGKDTFVHVSAFQNRKRMPQIQDVVTYSVSKDDRGRRRAARVRFAGEKEIKRGAGRRRSFPLATVVFFLVLLGLAAASELVPAPVLYAYLLASTIAMAAYGIDKMQARRGGWRLKERTLHILSVVGGWPGAIIAQEYLRHKSTKVSFRRMFWVTVVINVGALGWLLLTEDGETVLQALLQTLAAAT